MPLPLTQTPGGIQHFTYNGPIGVVGAPAQQTFDLTVFKEYLRKDQFFGDQLAIIVKSLDAAVSDATNLVITNGTDGLPAVATFDVFSSDINALVSAFVSVRHSPIR